MQPKCRVPEVADLFDEVVIEETTTRRVTLRRARAEASPSQLARFAQVLAFPDVARLAAGGGK